MADWSRCYSHQTHHIELSLMSVDGTSVLGNLFSMCMFLSSGGYFSRLRSAVKPWLRSAMVGRTRRGSLPANAQRFSECIVAYFEDTCHFDETYRQGRRAARWKHTFQLVHAAEGQGRAPSEAFLKTLKELLADWNVVEDDGPVHVCCGASCCPKGEESLFERLQVSLMATVLKSCPSPPAESKWTKLGPAVRNTILGTMLNVWLPLYKFAFKGFESNRKVGPRKGDAEHEEVNERVEFHEVQGKRFKRSMQLIESADYKSKLLVLTILLEPIQRVTHFFLDCSKDFRDSEAPPYLMTVLAPRHSPLNIAMQYMASLIFGPFEHVAGRAFLYCMAHGCATLPDLQRRRPREAKLYRRSVMCCLAWFWRKHVKRLSSFPWRLVTLADSRATMDTKEEVMRAWDATDACCLMPGMARRLKEMGLRGADFMEATWQTILYWIAFSLKLSIADIETRHPRNKVSCNTNGKTSFSLVVSHYVCAEYTEMVRAAASMLLSRRSLQVGSASSGLELATQLPSEPLVPMSGRLKGMGPVKLFQLDTDSGAPRSEGLFTKAYWDMIRARYAALPEERKAAYRERSLTSKHLAREARQRSASRSSSSALVPLAQGPQGDESLVAILSPNPPLPVPVNILQAYGFQVAASPMAASLSSALHTACNESLSRFEVLTSGDEEAAILSYLNHDHVRQFYKNRGVDNIARQFKDDSRRLSGPRGEPFPAAVSYPQCCEGLCRTKTPVEILKLQDELLKSFAAIASKASSFSAIPMEDIVLMCSAESEAGVDATFWWMIIASGRSGAVDPTETFMKLRPLGPFDPSSIGDQPCALEIERSASARPAEKQRRPYEEQTGVPKFFT